MARKESDKELDPIEKLEKRRAELEAKLERVAKKAHGEIGDLGFWGVAGGVALAVDWMLLGGVCTGLAVLSGATWFSQSREAKRLQKQITVIDEKLQEMQLERMRIEAQKPQPAPKPAMPNLSDEFSPAAQKEIDDLRARLSDMEKKMQEQQDATLQKPKFGAPKNK